MGGQIRLILRLAVTVAASLLMIITIPLLKGMIRIFSRDAARRFVWHFHQFVGKFLSSLYGIRIRVMGRRNIHGESGMLVVGNHVGYAELIALTSIIPVVFVAKEEVKKWPLLGLVFQVGGEVFVDRNSGGRSGEYAAAVEEALQQGINIFFAPEGTTSDGTILRRFKSPLFVPAKRQKRRILPFAYFVEKIDGEAVSPKNRDLVLWHSDMSFTPHFTKFLKLKHIDVVLNFGEAVLPDFDDSSLEGRRAFAAEMREIVDALYRPVNPFYSGRDE